MDGCLFRFNETILSSSLDRSISAPHILKIMSILFALKKAIQYSLHSCVMISTDNTTVVSYNNKQLGTHSPNICIEVWEIIICYLEQGTSLRTRHIPGKSNILQTVCPD